MAPTPSADDRGLGASAVIGVLGPVDLPEARDVEARALEAVRGGFRKIAVDLTQVTEIRAGLIGAVLRIRRVLARLDGELTLVVDGPPASALVQTAGLDVLACVATSTGEGRTRESARAVSGSAVAASTGAAERPRGC